MTTKEVNVNYETYIFDLWAELLTTDVENTWFLMTLNSHVWGEGYNQLTVTYHVEPGRRRMGAEDYVIAIASTDKVEWELGEKERVKSLLPFMSALLDAYYSHITEGTVELTLTLQENGDIAYSHAGFDKDGAPVEIKYVSVWDRMRNKGL